MGDVLTADDMEPLARGAALLGAGGGGDPYIGALMARRALQAQGPVDIVSVEDVPDDAVVFPVAMMGAPTVMVEKLPSIQQVTAAVDALAGHLDRTPTHVACIEAGGVNSTIPIVAAAALGLPLVDGDGMGRAFPELQMALPALSGVMVSPLAISDDKGNIGILETVSNIWAERLARTATVEMGCSSIVSLFAMSGTQVRECFVPATLSGCVRLGRSIERARTFESDMSPVATVLEQMSAQLLITGKVVDIVRRTVSGFARGEARVEGAGDISDGPLILHFQNEHLIAQRGNRILATTPDLILVVDKDTGEPITTEALRFGHRVAVLAASAHPRWHTPDAIKLVGPKYFGYDTDPVTATRPKNQEMS